MSGAVDSRNHTTELRLPLKVDIRDDGCGSEDCWGIEDATGEIIVECDSGVYPPSIALAHEIVWRVNEHDGLVAELKLRHWSVIHAAGFGALLNEILGSGSLSRERNRDLYDRVRQAADDHEEHIRALLAKAGT